MQGEIVRRNDIQTCHRCGNEMDLDGEVLAIPRDFGSTMMDYYQQYECALCGARRYRQVEPPPPAPKKGRPWLAFALWLCAIALMVVGALGTVWLVIAFFRGSL